ncbi:hypothetical protein ACB092_03G125000 [Castanea dentata]
MRTQLLLWQRLLRGHALLRAQAGAQLLPDVALVRPLLPHELSLPLIPLHPSPSSTIPSPTPHPSPSPTIPPPTPHSCPGSDIRPPTPRSFPELSPIPSFDLGIDPNPPDSQQQEPPSHNMSTGPSSGIDPPHVQAEQAIGLPAVAEGRPKRISKAPPCGIGGTNMDRKLGLRHLTKDMQDLLLIIRDSVSETTYLIPSGIPFCIFQSGVEYFMVNDTIGTLARGRYSNKDVVAAAVILVSIIELINCFLFFPNSFLPSIL